jgi:hypothetical protein
LVIDKRLDYLICMRLRKKRVPELKEAIPNMSDLNRGIFAI